MMITTATCVVFAFTALAFVRKASVRDAIVMYIIDFPLLLAYGVTLYITYETFIIMVASIAIGCLAFYALYKAIDNLMESRRS